MAGDQLRFEQLAEAARIERAAVEDGFVRRRLRVGATVPVAHELLEVDVADLGAVDAAHAGWDGLGGGVHGSFLLCRPERSEGSASTTNPSLRSGWRALNKGQVVDAASRAALSAAGSGMATNAGVARTRVNQSLTAG